LEREYKIVQGIGFYSGVHPAHPAQTWDTLSAIMACIPAGRRGRQTKTEALQNMGTEPDPKRQPIHSLIVRWRAYQRKRQDGAGRG